MNEKGEIIQRVFLQGLKLNSFEAGYKINLTNSNFSGSYLTGANFSGSNLVGADFSGAILYETKFHQANLMLSNFREILFKGENYFSRWKNTKFDGSNLKQANFGKVYLYDDVSFNGCDLTGTNFEGAVFDLDEVDFDNCFVTIPIEERQIWEHKKYENLNILFPKLGNNFKVVLMEGKKPFTQTTRKERELFQAQFSIEKIEKIKSQMWLKEFNQKHITDICFKIAIVSNRG